MISLDIFMLARNLIYRLLPRRKHQLNIFQVNDLKYKSMGHRIGDVFQSVDLRTYVLLIEASCLMGENKVTLHRDWSSRDEVGKRSRKESRSSELLGNRLGV